ncbi:SHOCT domain-containing protein [Schlesneria paludicola]|uniref:SHOCT domain-containing protein n=1 Tax=Schlesneria paludicola TaxID=360056 RepID=UPI0002FDF99A|nr:SHOCT domain-containing protein [Schlesneria paludicola]
MSLTDELQKLEQLRQNGTLTEDEFTRAKSLLLATPAPTLEVNPAIETQLSQLRHLSELERIDREWSIERRQYEVVGRYGRRYVPSTGESLATILLGGTLGTLWTAGAIVVTSATSSIGLQVSDRTIGAYLLPGVGILVILISTVFGLSRFIIAQNYRSAYRAYQQRHEQAAAAKN